MRHLLFTAILAAGCANTSGNTSATCAAIDSTAMPKPPPQWSGTIYTIVMENHSRSEILGNKSAPFINALAAQNAVAAGYHDSYVHPSEPNYLWMVAGENFGILDDNDPGSHHLSSTSHLADQIELAGLTWKTYQESMGEPCGLKSHGRYAAKHNPFVYFNDVNGWDGTAYHPELRCNDHVVDYSQLDVDLANHAVPRYAFITPNLDSDMHDQGVAYGDTWLANEVPKILADESFTNGGALFLFWDEGGGSPASDDPPFIVISPNAQQGMVSKTNFDTSSYLKTVQDMLGLQELPCSPKADTVNNMAELFTVPLTAPTSAGP